MDKKKTQALETAIKTEETQNDRQEQQSKVQLLLEAVLVGTQYYAPVILFRTPENVGHVIIHVPQISRIDGNIPEHKEVHRIRGKSFKHYLYHVMRDTYGGTSINKTQLQEVIDNLEADACDPREKAQPVYLRIAPYKDDRGEKVYIDLCNDAYEAVEIDTDGWRIVTDPPVHFIREAGMQPLPTPEQGGTLDELREFLHLQGDANTTTWHRIVFWLMGALNPRGPYTILHPTGEHGSFKSSLARYLHQLIDPHTSLLRDPPRNEEAMTTAAHNCHVLAFDNLSSMPQWLSDSLCRLATGIGETRRTHYEMTEETVFYACRPLIYTSIGEIATKGDLLDRTLIVELPPVREGRKSEKKLREEFKLLWPRVLGVFYDAVSMALCRYETLDDDDVSRMADAELWVRAAAPALGMSEEDVKFALHSNQEDAVQVELEELIPRHLLDYMLTLSEQDGKRVYDGLLSQLYEEIKVLIGDDGVLARKWPKTAHHFSNKLKSHAPALRKAGVDIREMPRRGSHRYIIIHDTREISQKEQVKEQMNVAKERARTNGHNAKHNPLPFDEYEMEGEAVR